MTTYRIDGYGLVDVTYRIRSEGDARDFVAIGDGECLLSAEAAEAKDAYDQHLRAIYDKMLAEKAPDITALLGAA